MEWRSTEQKVESEEGEEDWLDVAARRRTRQDVNGVRSSQVKSGLVLVGRGRQDVTHVRTGQAGCDSANAARQLGGGGRWACGQAAHAPDH